MSAIARTNAKHRNLARQRFSRPTYLTRRVGSQWQVVRVPVGFDGRYERLISDEPAVSVWDTEPAAEAEARRLMEGSE